LKKVKIAWRCWFQRDISQAQKAGISAEAIGPRLVRIFGAEYTELLMAREKLLKKIRVTEQHFSVSLSESLSKHLYDLMREDAHLQEMERREGMGDFRRSHFEFSLSFGS
jgi:hypothetical protein